MIVGRTTYTGRSIFQTNFTSMLQILKRVSKRLVYIVPSNLSYAPSTNNSIPVTVTEGLIRIFAHIVPILNGRDSEGHVIYLGVAFTQIGNNFVYLHGLHFPASFLYMYQI